MVSPRRRCCAKFGKKEGLLLAIRLYSLDCSGLIFGVLGSTRFHRCIHTPGHGIKVFVLSGADEVLEALEDHQMQLQGMAGMGKFVDFFRQEVRDRCRLMPSFVGTPVSRALLFG